ncbi:MAG: ABC transporter ATP-binding protein [Rhodanobacter sp.]
MIRLESCSHRYVSDDLETRALTAVDLEFARGEFVAVMGPSGCGKSTLLNILATAERPSAGRYWFGNEDLAVAGEARLASFRAETLGFVFQLFNLVDTLTVEENVALALAYGPTSRVGRGALVAEALDRVGIAHRARYFPHQLSGGQQQRAAIARAIVTRPDLLLADEPTGNLDSESGAVIMRILASLHAEGTTIIMATHSPAHADLAGRRIDMLDGRIVSSLTSIF